MYLPKSPVWYPAWCSQVAMVLSCSPRLLNFCHPPRGSELPRIWVLWGYCPRWMVARAGQHKGKVDTVLVSFTPSLVTLLLRFGISFSVLGNWSSVRTKMMLGFWEVCFTSAPHPAASTAAASTAATASSWRTFFPLLVLLVNTSSPITCSPLDLDSLALVD